MNTLSAVFPEKYSEKELLSFLLAGSDRQTPLALWRMPGAPQKHLIISDNCRRVDSAAALEDFVIRLRLKTLRRSESDVSA